MALVEIFPSITQEQIGKTLLRCQIRAALYVRENPTGRKPLTPDFEELLDNMVKLSEFKEDKRPPTDIKTLIDRL